MTNIDGQLVALPRDIRARLESVIAEHTGGSLNSRGGAGVEYWIIGRRDLESLMLCQRLTLGQKKGVVRGSLAPDLSALLVAASKPRAGDIFLDPFAGSGSIVGARVESPFRRAILSDTNLGELRGKIPRRLLKSRDIEVMSEDALRLPSIPDGSITSIITDPPWGEHEDLESALDKFYAEMLASFDRVLDQRDGRLILLQSRRTANTVARTWNEAHIQVRQTHEILVNGHPATVLVGTR